jgi:hypothetical protein
MSGRKVFSNEKGLLKIACWVWVAWTVCCIIIIPAALAEVDAGKMRNARINFSRGDVYWLALIVWGAGTAAVGAGAMAFWKARYQIDYQGSSVEVFHSWPKKQLLVNSELQDENTDFSFGRVELLGKIKSGEATGHAIKVSFAPFGTTVTPVCVVIDNTVVFRG